MYTIAIQSRGQVGEKRAQSQGDQQKAASTCQMREVESQCRTRAEVAEMEGKRQAGERSDLEYCREKVAMGTAKEVSKSRL